jgi:hypothetical protein
MKLFNLRLTTLKSKLYAIVFASFVVRVTVLLLLPSDSTQLAPDESTYSALTEWLARGNISTEFPVFGDNLYKTTRGFILPAVGLTHLGFSAMDAIRMISSLYGLLTAILACNLIILTFREYENKVNYRISVQTISIFLFSLFVFTPSSFLWSLLGLRESATSFWVLLTFFILFLNPKKFGGKSFLYCTVIFLSLVMVFHVRPQVGLLLGVTLLMVVGTKLNSRDMGTLFCFLAIFAATITGYYSAQNNTEDSAQKNTETNISNGTQEISTVTNGKAQVSDSKLTSFVKTLDERKRLNQEGARSAITTEKCSVSSISEIGKLICSISKLPESTAAFLFRPMPGTDVKSTSSLFAAIENVFWLGAFLFVVVMFIRNRRLAFFGALTPSLLFFTLYSVAAGAYEGNMGTAFRHKSLILWVVILLLASTIVATQQRKAEREGISGSS